MDCELFKDAYRKLKGSVYCDKSLEYVKTKIALFEEKNVDDSISDLTVRFNGDDWDSAIKQIADSIEVLTFPKHIEYMDLGTDNQNVISNVKSSKCRVNGYNNFIDMNIEGFILGMLWIITVGYKMDSELGDCCYGNRLNQRLILEDNKVTLYPDVFVPYFVNYKAWRENGLKKAQNESDSSTIISFLDLSRFYFNVDYTEERQKRVLQKYCSTEEEKRLTDFVFEIARRYSDLLGFDHLVLPIGFHPSSILANDYLRDLDERFQTLGDIVYYGRYVDDILLIQRIPNEYDFPEMISENGLSVVSDYVIDKLCVGGIGLRENDAIRVQGEKYLSFQKQKLRFFYFDQQGSDVLIKKIEEELKKNSSEFRFVPDENDLLNFEFQTIQRDDYYSGIKGNKGTVIDRYVLSKAFGKSNVLSQMNETYHDKNFPEKIIKCLENRDLVDNYMFWDSMLTSYIVNQQYSESLGLVARIIESLRNLDEDSSKIKEYLYLKNGFIHSVKKSLIYHLESCVARSFALVWGADVENFLKKLKRIISVEYSESKKLNELTRIRRLYVRSRMVNMKFIPLSLDFFVNNSMLSCTGRVFRLFDIDDLMTIGIKRRISKYPYSPCISSPFEIGLSKLVSEISGGKGTISCFEELLEYIKSEYDYQLGVENSLDDILNSSDREIRVECKGEVKRIAVANIMLSLKDITDIFDGKSKENKKRRADIVKLSNIAINNNADVLVFPEASVPLRYLNVLGKKAAANQMAIICGVEHIVYKGSVWNLTCTIIPFSHDEVKYSIPFFRQKKYFSPKESKLVGDKHLKIPDARPNKLFNWRKVKFASYCCYDLTNIVDRSEFKGIVDIVFGVEWNKDISYFSNIMESLSRDLYCFCVQSNMSVYGDSRIVQPAHRISRDIMRVKGGENSTVLIGEVDLNHLYNMRNKIRKDNSEDFTELPAGYRD